MLKQFPNVRVVCHDEGVEGEFRIRNLRTFFKKYINNRDNHKEHGHEFQINSAEVYFSGRLSTQRKSTFEAVKSFKQTKGRPLVVKASICRRPHCPFVFQCRTCICKLRNDMNPSAKRSSCSKHGEIPSDEKTRRRVLCRLHGCKGTCHRSTTVRGLC